MTTDPENNNTTAACSIDQAISSLERHLASIRTEMPWFKESTLFWAEPEDEELLSDFMADVNAVVGVEAVAPMRVTAFAVGGMEELLGFLAANVPWNALWGGAVAWCVKRRCSLKITLADGKSIEVTAASPAQAERLLKLGSRIKVGKKTKETER